MIWWLNNDTEDKAQKRRYNVITSHRYLYIVLLDTHSYLEIRKTLNLHVTDALSNLHPKSKPPEHTLALTACFLGSIVPRIVLSFCLLLDKGSNRLRTEISVFLIFQNIHCRTTLKACTFDVHRI